MNDHVAQARQRRAGRLIWRGGTGRRRGGRRRRRLRSRR